MSIIPIHTPRRNRVLKAGTVFIRIGTPVLVSRGSWGRCIVSCPSGLVESEGSENSFQPHSQRNVINKRGKLDLKVCLLLGDHFLLFTLKGQIFLAGPSSVKAKRPWRRLRLRQIGRRLFWGQIFPRKLLLHRCSHSSLPNNPALGKF